ncbi:hypothetical protein [Kushneria phosphatilytica]|uniref:hypothetical protein n=1 Tax=Kushneria phosphatilytica TaxID=657387 RepID=UPI001F293805|nr:hypothetical protein [Kushneria phosphatilytica]
MLLAILAPDTNDEAVCAVRGTICLVALSRSWLVAIVEGALEDEIAEVKVMGAVVDIRALLANCACLYTQ